MNIDGIKFAVNNGVFGKDIESNRQDAKMREICQDFESVFVSYLLKSMRKTVPSSDLNGNGFSQEYYTSMMDEEIARNVAKGSGIGLAEVLYRQFTEKKKF